MHKVKNIGIKSDCNKITIPKSLLLSSSNKNIEISEDKNRILIKKKTLNHDGNLFKDFTEFKTMTILDKKNYIEFLKNSRTLDFDFFVHEVQYYKSESVNLGAGLKAIKTSSNILALNSGHQRKRVKSAISLKCSKKRKILIKVKRKKLNKENLLKKKKKHASSLFDIDNFVLHFATRVQEKKERLNIPVPKYSLIPEDFLNLHENYEIKDNDEYYLDFHKEYEERERLFKQNYYLSTDKENKNEHIIPCHYQFRDTKENKERQSRLNSIKEVI